MTADSVAIWLVVYGGAPLEGLVLRRRLVCVGQRAVRAARPPSHPRTLVEANLREKGQARHTRGAAGQYCVGAALGPRTSGVLFSTSFWNSGTPLIESVRITVLEMPQKKSEGTHLLG